MQRIPTIVKKITELAKQEDKNTVIDIDLMLDYTRVLYADLLEWRSKLSFTESLAIHDVATPTDKIAPQKQDATSINKIEDKETETNHSTESPQQTLFTGKTGAPQKDIRHSIGINDKYQFISELFGNNKEAYEETIRQINTCATFQQALSWLDAQVYKQYYWNEDSEAVQSFYGVLTSFFSEQ